MKITLESTTAVVQLETRGGAVMPARVWEGRSDSGIPVQAFITRIALAVPEGEVTPSMAAEFARDLEEQKKPTLELPPLSLRFFID